MTRVRSSTEEPVITGLHEVGRLLARAVALFRGTSPSMVAADQRTVAIALMDEGGEIISISPPSSLGSIATTGRTLVERSSDNLASGQVIITNDPYVGGTTVRDFVLVTSANLESGLGHLLLRFPTVDVGGDLMGSINPKARDVWAEGIRISPSILREGETLDLGVLELILFNSRLPDLLRHDLISALTVLDDLASDLGDKGPPKEHNSWESWFSDVLTEGEARTETSLRSAKTEPTRSTHLVSHCCSETCDLPIVITTNHLDGILDIDFSGTAEAAEAPINATAATSVGAVVLPLLGLLGDMPANGGLLRKVRFQLPEQSLVNAVRSVPTGWSPYSTAMSISERISKIAAEMDLLVVDHAPWTAPPRIRFNVPSCGDPNCYFGSASSHGNEASRYSRT